MKELEAIKARTEGHTEGPWEVESMDSGHSRYAADFWITAGDAGDTVCGMDGLSRATLNERVARDDGRADAELIAAAPKLLAALEAVDGICEYLLAEFPTMKDATLAKGWNHARKVMRELITEALQ